MSALTVEEDGSTREQAFTSVTDRLDKLITLMEAQAKYMQPVAKTETGSRAAPAPSSVFQEVSEHLRKIHEKQAAADMASRQPLPQSSATSASAWSALLRSHMNNVDPIISQWRGTLDTLLIFVALFSAIVTALYVQSLASLSPDTGERTNELLQNLTEVIIVLQGASGVHLNFTQPSVFEPASGVIRLNFYFSISLVLSISIAALAVTSRGYITMLTRSSHRQAHKKLGELHRRWLEANRLLAPAIEALPQLLILPVLLFIIGLIDMLLSSSIPLSNSDSLLFAAGVISCVFIVAIGIYTVWTVVHGCTHPDLSPFQSTFSRVLVSRGPGWLKTMKDTPLTCLKLWYKIVTSVRKVKNDYLLPLFNARQSDAQNDNGSPHHEPVAAVPTKGHSPIIDADDFYGPRTVIAMHEHEAFHGVLHHTHDDAVLDQAAAALLPLARSRFPIIQGLHLDPEQRPRVSPLEKNAILYLLSDEASIRSNLTAATAICLSRPLEEHDFLPMLQHAATRYSYHTSGLPTSKELLDSPFTKAMAYILCDDSRLPWNLTKAHEELLTKAPWLSILLTDRRSMFLKSNSAQRVRPEGVALYDMHFILNILYDSLRQVIPLWRQVDHFFLHSGVTPLLDKLSIYQGYRIRSNGNEIGAHLEQWDHPIFAALMLGFSTTESSAGQSLNDVDARQIVAIRVAGWFIKRYYHSPLHSLPIDLSSAIRGILKHPLMDAVREDHMFLDPEDRNGALNLFYLGMIFNMYNTAYAHYADSIRGNSAQLASHSRGYLQTAVEVVDFIFMISKVHTCRSSDCEACKNEKFSAHNGGSHFPPSLFCAFQDDTFVCILRNLRRRAPFVRMTVEETELVQRCLSRPDGGLPIYHKTHSHSENVRHIWLKSFMRFAPEVPVLPHHYYRAERFGIDDTFTDINWTWFETALLNDPVTSETN